MNPRFQISDFKFQNMKTKNQTTTGAAAAVMDEVAGYERAAERENGGPTIAAVIGEARAHAEMALEALKKGCEHALIAGLHLKWLHKDLNVTNGRNQYSVGVSRETPTFYEAVAQIDIPRPTAYRWMNAAEAACLRATLIFPGDDFGAELPEPGMPRWDEWEKQVKGIAQGMSLNRLMLGAQQGGTEVARMDTLIHSEEEGSERAIALMTDVENGRYTLAQALKALGSQEAYDQLRAAGGEKVRRDPVYLDYDVVNKCPVGLIPKSFTALQNGFKQWDDYDEDAREAVKVMFREMAKEMPSELVRMIVGGGK